MSNYYDALETRDPEQRESEQLGAVSKQIAHAKANAPGFGRVLKDVDPNAITSRAALAKVPITRKADLKRIQAELPPLGGLNATPIAKLAKVFVSPGQIYEPDALGRDGWRMARALHAAGFRSGDIAINTFTYHFTPAGAMAERGALACGVTVVPAGVGQTEMQVSTIAGLSVNAYIGTPSFLKLIIDKADELRADISCLTKAIVSAEYLPPLFRAGCAERGMSVMQCYATADLGLLAYETRGPDGKLCDGLIVDEGILLEIVRPGTGNPVPEGEVGEVVVTSFNPDYPLIRFATGDLSAVLRGESPCGRTNVRIKGWMGRADQTTKVRGMFVHPSQVADVVKRYPAIRRARLVVDRLEGQDRMTLHCEIEGEPNGLGEAITTAVRELTKLRGEVAFRPLGELPNDGRVIEDVRKYD
jgi:phenylacetate-CoA ligase